MYRASKTLAEKEAWKFWEDTQKRGVGKWDLVAICPPLVSLCVQKEGRTEAVGGLGCQEDGWLIRVCVIAGWVCSQVFGPIMHQVETPEQLK
jgi:hypothetical protein